jgi:putative endonuclease
MFIDSKNTNQRKTIGNYGERFVADWLKQHNFSILAHNFATKMGEVDIIARTKDLIIFVEVKTRTSDYFALSQIIVPSKQRKIVATAASFILENKLYRYSYRFDVALLCKKNDQFELNYIENAFAPDDEKWISASLF